MAESKRGKQLQKGGADIPVGKLKLGGVAVLATADELNGAAPSQNNQVVSADGAITIKRGVAVVTKAGVAAMTIADPVATTDDFKQLKVISATAQAHTLSN